VAHFVQIPGRLTGLGILDDDARLSPSTTKEDGTGQGGGSQTEPRSRRLTVLAASGRSGRSDGRGPASGGTSSSRCTIEIVFWTALGDVFPVAIAIGLSPFAVVTVVVLLMGDNGRGKATLFACGWLVVIFAIAAVAYLIVDATEEANASASADGVDVVQLVLGLGFFGLAWLSWRKRQRQGEDGNETKTLDRVTRITPVGALALGMLQGVVVVKNIPLALSGGAQLGESDVRGGQAVIALLVFAIVASAGMIALILLSVIGGERFDGPIAAFRQWLEANMTAITIVVTVVIGAVLVGRGIAIFD
jgi:hypothetical protein